MRRTICIALPMLAVFSTVPAQKAVEPKQPERRTVAILVHEGVELLDFAGPGEVFAVSKGERGRAFDVHLVAASRKPIKSQRFVEIIPGKTFDELPDPDIVVIPGGATRRAMDDLKTLAWIEKAAPKAEVVLSVCTGAVMLASAGLLDDLEATTHWGALDHLRRAAPKTKVHAKCRFVDNGGIVTTAGVSAGIDGALHVVERLLGLASAKYTARYMEYRWQRDAPKVVTKRGKAWKPRVAPPPPAEPDGYEYVCPPCPVDCHDRTYDRPGRCEVCWMKLIRKKDGKKGTAESDRKGSSAKK